MKYGVTICADEDGIPADTGRHGVGSTFLAAAVSMAGVGVIARATPPDCGNSGELLREKTDVVWPEHHAAEPANAAGCRAYCAGGDIGRGQLTPTSNAERGGLYRTPVRRAARWPC